MTEQKEKKQPNSTTGFLFIAAGVFGGASKLIGKATWTTISIVELCIYIAAIVGGLWIILKKK